MLLATACGGDDDDDDDAADVANAISILDNAGLHEIDESIKNDREIPADAKSTVQKLQAVTELTDWPDELQAEADALADIFGEFVTALSPATPDLDRAAEASKKAHDAEHEFSHEVWKHLYEEAGISTSGSSGH